MAEIISLSRCCRDIEKKIDQSPESLVQSPESRVQSPESRVQSPESRVQSPESRVQSPESRVQSPGSSPESSPGFRLCPTSLLKETTSEELDWIEDTGQILVTAHVSF
ncbi:hypothetical protein ACROYT_G000749 [Oculina patagonica]